tara:strand:- start:1089 stop:1313 length:225 start_codon:yes stop_codon:yes gene_type:complete
MFKYEEKQNLDEKIIKICDLGLEPDREQLRILGSRIKEISKSGYYYRQSREAHKSDLKFIINQAKSALKILNQQ